MIVLDTHILVWLDQDLPELGNRARKMIEREHRGGEVMVSAISFWEIGMLIAKGRLKLNMDLVTWRAELLAAGYEELQLDGQTSIAAANLPSFHGDPADRLIVASSQRVNARLVTADRRILDYKKIKTTDGRR